MNGSLDSKPEEGMIEKILSDGRAQAERAIDNARRSAEAERRKAEAEAGKVRAEIIGQAERKMKVQRSKEVASGHIEAKRMLLRAREEAVSRILETIEGEVAKVRQNPSAYKEALLNLAAEAVAAIGTAEVVLKVATEDEALADGAFLEDVTARIGAGTGDSIKLDLELDPAVSSGGCVAVSPDGRIVFDNTFKRRLERMRPELRSLIVNEVLRTNG